MEYFLNYDNFLLSEGLKYHVDNKIPLHECIYRYGTDNFLKLFNEARNNNICFDSIDSELLSTDIGLTSEYNGETVYLDLPFEELNEAEYKGREVKLNKPFRTPGESKKFAVYVKNDKGNVVKVRFGDPNLKVKNSNPKRSKAFKARFARFKNAPKTSAGYWAYHLGRYAKLLGLKSSSTW